MMTHFEAMEYREKNLHLIGQIYKGLKITNIVIYPKDENLLNDFLMVYATRNFEPIVTATMFNSENYGLMIHCAHRTVEFAYTDISDLGEEYNVELPEDYN